MRKVLLLSLIALTLMLVRTPRLQAQLGCSVSGISLATTGAASSNCYVPAGQGFYYTVTGVWAGTVEVDYSVNQGQSWVQYTSITANASAVVSPQTFNAIWRVYFTARTSGTVTGNELGLLLAPGRLQYGNIPIGPVAYASIGTNTTMVAGTLYITDIVIPRAMTVTSIQALNATTIGTDNHMVALFDGAGHLLGNSAVAGALAAGANTFQSYSLTSPVPIPAGLYYVAVQSNGTTATISTLPASTYADVETTSTTGVFGTIPTVITPPTTFTATVGPVVYVVGF